MANRIAVWSLVATVVGTVVALGAWLLPGGGGGPSPSFESSAASSEDRPGPPGTVQGPSRADYIRRADDICHRWSLAAGETATIHDALDRAREQHRILSSMVIEWRAVTPPADDREVVDEIIDHYQTAVDLASDMIAAAERGDAASLQRFLTLFEEEQDIGMQKAREYGLRVC